MLLAGVLWLELVEDSDASILQSVLLALLGVDAILCCLFYTIQCKSHHINGTLDKLVIVPGTIQTRLIAGWLYMLLVVVALFAHATPFIPHNAVAYSMPLLVLLRNENIW